MPSDLISIFLLHEDFSGKNNLWNYAYTNFLYISVAFNIYSIFLFKFSDFMECYLFFILITNQIRFNHFNYRLIRKSVKSRLHAICDWVIRIDATQSIFSTNNRNADECVLKLEICIKKKCFCLKSVGFGYFVIYLFCSFE